MKKNVLILLAFLIVAACKDKNKDEPKPSTSLNQVSVKINGTNFACTNCGNTYKSSGFSGINFMEGTSNRFIFSFTGFLAAGSYSLIPFGNPSFTYEKDGRFFRGRGSLNLTQTDTSSNGATKKFIGTFNCVTDTNGGVFYNFSEGILNVNFN